MLAFTFQCVSFSLGVVQLKEVTRLRLEVRKWIRAPHYDIIFLQCNEAMTFPVGKMIGADGQPQLAAVFAEKGDRPVALQLLPPSLLFSEEDSQRSERGREPQATSVFWQSQYI